MTATKRSDKDSFMNEMIKNLSKIARDAGQAIMAVRSKGFEVVNKKDDSPVTAADIASNEVIMKALTKLYPSTPVLSEEGADIPFSERQTWNEFFLVDPLDGTKEFIKDNGEFCVCIALMRNSRPVLGVVYAPTSDTLYTGCAETGAYITRENSVPEKITTKPAAENEGLVVVGSRSHPSPDLEKYLSAMNVAKMTPAGSAIKFCLVAEGKAHIYPRFNPTMEWDTGAGQAIVEAAGGMMVGLDGKDFPYNKENLRNKGFFVTA